MTKDIELVSPDGRTLKFNVTSISFNDNVDIKKQTALNVATDVVGYDAILNASNINVTAVIDQAEAENYPNSNNYNGYDNWGFVLEARKFTKEVTPSVEGRTEMRLKLPFGTIVERGAVESTDFNLDLEDETIIPNGFSMTINFNVYSAYFKNRGDPQ